MWARVLDLLYPALCEFCSTPLQAGGSLCPSCADSLPRLKPPFCATCGESFDGYLDESVQCRNCHGIRHDFDFARAALTGLGQSFDLVHRLKYRRHFYLARDLSGLLQETLENDDRFQAYDDALLVPVPLHWRRQQWRHGNQAYELARELARHSGLRLCDGLLRKRSTRTQTKLTRQQRLSNLRGAFALKKKHLTDFRDRPAILIDDVFTTGATTHECSRLLRQQGGAARVAVLTLLRG